MRQQCERCEKQLKAHENDAYICSYECTYCHECTHNELMFKCPGCGGVLVQRPNRIKKIESVS